MKAAFFMLVLCLVIALFGCGGSGGGKATQKLTRAQVEDILRGGLAGIDDLPSGPSGGRSAKSKGLTPKGSSGLLRKASRSGGRGPDGIYWNSDYELWALDFMDGDPEAEHSWGTHFYLDEEATQPAGDDVWNSQWGAWPQIDDEELRITGGPWAGLSTNVHMVFNEDGRGTEDANGFVPGEGSWEYTMSWIDGGYATIDAKYTDLEGAWTRYVAVPNEDGTHSYTITTSAGVKIVLNFNWDYSGEGTITGPSDSLPATMVWDETGEGTITWADGTEGPFSIWDF